MECHADYVLGRLFTMVPRQTRYFGLPPGGWETGMPRRLPQIWPFADLFADILIHLFTDLLICSFTNLLILYRKNVLIRAPAVGLEKYFPVPEVRAGWLFLWQAAPDLTLLLLLLVLWAIASVTSLVQKWGTGTVYGLETRWDRGALGQRSLLYTPSSCAVPSSMNEATRGVSKATLTSCGPPSNQATLLKHFFSAHYGILT